MAKKDAGEKKPIIIRVKTIPITSTFKLDPAALGVPINYSQAMPSITQAVVETDIELELEDDSDGETEGQQVLREIVEFVSRPLDEANTKRAIRLVELLQQGIRDALARRDAEDMNL